MTKKRFKLMPTVSVFLKKDDKFLLMKRKNTGWEDGKFALIGGGVDGKETVIKAAVREVKEECGVDIDINDLKVVHVLHIKFNNDFENDVEAISFFLEATKWDGEPTNMEPDKCEKLEWHSFDNVPENTVDVLKHVLKQINKNVFYSEFGW